MTQVIFEVEIVWLDGTDDVFKCVESKRYDGMLILTLVNGASLRLITRNMRWFATTTK